MIRRHVLGIAVFGIVAVACSVPVPVAGPGETTRAEPTPAPSSERPEAPTTVDVPAGPEPRPLPTDRPSPEATFVADSLEQAKREGEAWFRRYAQCLIDGNWPVTSNAAGDGFTVGSIPVEQREAFWEADADCQRQAGPRPVAPPPSEEEIAQIYEQLLEVADCLRKEGYDIAPAPSLEAFVDSYETGPWHPYLSLPDDLSASEWDRLERVCPQP